jgi:mono/diheme cytochrome c family protein
MMTRRLVAVIGLALPLAPCRSARAAVADDVLVARGAYLAKAGDCFACHSAPKGKPFAGGLPMTTPMGRIYTQCLASCAFRATMVRAVVDRPPCREWGRR